MAMLLFVKLMRNNRDRLNTTCVRETAPLKCLFLPGTAYIITQNINHKSAMMPARAYGANTTL